MVVVVASSSMIVVKFRVTCTLTSPNFLSNEKLTASISNDDFTFGKRDGDKLHGKVSSFTEELIYPEKTINITFITYSNLLEYYRHISKSNDWISR